MKETVIMLNEYNIAKLRRTQIEKGWTDEKLASEANLGTATVWRAMNPATTRTRPSRTTVSKIAFALGVPLTDIVIPEADVTVPADSPITTRATSKKTVRGANRKSSMKCKNSVSRKRESVKEDLPRRSPQRTKPGKEAVACRGTE
ncbi:MAG: hypothetical protein KAV00_03560 [Phycisphaerae bacterium]|nr:hypothetical protein [Phycisphaerae bacterium]